MTLKHGDLRDLIYHILEIDSYKSKMGSDDEIVTLSFSSKTKEAAEDLANFVEKGYDFVLDADVTAGEQSDGTYKVFVELERNNHSVGQILEIANGLENLTGLDKFKFRYYKNWKSKTLDNDNLQETLPLDKQSYEQAVNESNMSNYKNFFNKSYVESVDMYDDVLRIKKPFSEPLFFKVLEFGDKDSIVNSITESLNFNDFAEVIFLSKYIGDYNITKYGNKLIFENENSSLIVERIT